LSIIRFAEFACFTPSEFLFWDEEKVAREIRETNEIRTRSLMVVSVAKYSDDKKKPCCRHINSR